MELYIKQNLLSILNQSFQDFEIIIVNDFSKDKTENIIRDLQKYDCRIKLVNHHKNLGVYHSRIEAILNSNGEYILLMDPDDMYLNPDLFKDIYDYNLKNNLDIIEFSVFNKMMEKKKYFCLIIIMKFITMAFQRRLFRSLSYQIYCIILLEQRNIAKQFVEIFGIK